MGHILIIEDDICTQTSIARLLERRGHQIHCVYDGGEGIEALQGRSFDLAIIDMHLADMTGLEVIQYISSQDKRLPIIGISGGNPHQAKNMDLLKSISSMNMVETIRKPLDIQEFLEMVGQSIEKRYHA